MPWNEEEARESSAAGEVYMQLRNRGVTKEGIRKRKRKRGQPSTEREIMMPLMLWNEEEEIMMPWNEEEKIMLRNRTVTKKQLRKRKRKPKKFTPSKALRGESERLAHKYAPKLSDGPDYWSDMIRESDEIDSDSGSSRDNLPPPRFSSSSSWVASWYASRTPQVLDHSGSSRGIPSSSVEKYDVMARLALEYYNFKQDTNLKLRLVTAASRDFDSVERVHINFLAYFDDDHSECLLFAELLNDGPIYQESDFSKYYVQGCCVIDKVDSGNPLGRRCPVCPSDRDFSDKVRHPGPADGYRIISGDSFQGYNFWEYHPFAYEKSARRKSNPEQWARSAAMYAICAKKALEYFNSDQQQVTQAKVLFQFTKLEDVEVIGGAHRSRCEYGTTVHISFLSQQKLFFAVLFIPEFDIETGWEDWKEDFVKVETCCRLEKKDSGNPLGRVCSICRFFSVGEVIHPSPRDGYCAADGNVSNDYDFMAVGSGIF